MKTSHNLPLVVRWGNLQWWNLQCVVPDSLKDRPKYHSQDKDHYMIERFRFHLMHIGKVPKAFQWFPSQAQSFCWWHNRLSEFDDNQLKKYVVLWKKFLLLSHNLWPINYERKKILTGIRQRVTSPNGAVSFELEFSKVFGMFSLFFWLFH